jgi:preprotein translocase subunit SecA
MKKQYFLFEKHLNFFLIFGIYSYNLLTKLILTKNIMLDKFLKSIFGDPNEKKVKEYAKLVEQIKVNEKKLENFSLEDIKNKTSDFKKLFEGLDYKKEEDSIKIKEILEDIKLEAFAVVKTTCKLIN